MKTDAQIYQIFQAEPEFLFLLTRLPSPGKSRFQSVELKALARTADGVNLPENVKQRITVLEVQIQKDEVIYTRLVVEMALVQEAHGGREVQGIILFRDRSLDPQTPPWNRIVHSFSLTELLAEFEKSHPHHPLVAVFKPVFLDDERALAENAAGYYRDISQSELDERSKNALVHVLISWLLQRFTHMGRKEIEAMLIGELPNLEDTQAGKELIEIGEKRGEKRGEEQGEKRGEERGLALGIRQALATVLQARHAVIPEEILQKIATLDLGKAQQLLPIAVRCEDLEVVRKWLAEN